MTDDAQQAILDAIDALRARRSALEATITQVETAIETLETLTDPPDLDGPDPAPPRTGRDELATRRTVPHRDPDPEPPRLPAGYRADGAATASAVLAALNPHRDMGTEEIARRAKLAVSAVRYHLPRLVESGQVDRIRRGQYRLAGERGSGVTVDGPIEKRPFDPQATRLGAVEGL